MDRSFDTNNVDFEAFDEIMALYIVEPSPEPSSQGTTLEPASSFTAPEVAEEQDATLSSLYNTSAFQNNFMPLPSPYQSLSLAMPEYYGYEVNAFDPRHSASVAQGERTSDPYSARQIHLQDRPSNLQHLPQAGPQTPVSPTGSITSAHALSRSSSDRRHTTPSVSDEGQTLSEPGTSSRRTQADREAARRERNREAATRGRRRREADVSRMQADILEIGRERDIWRERVRMMQAMLQKAGHPVPRFPDSS